MPLPSFMLQEVSAGTIPPHQFVTPTFSLASAKGNILIAILRGNGSSGAHTVFDGAGNTWVPLFSTVAVPDGVSYASIWRAVSKGFGAGNAVTLFAPGSVNTSGYIMELQPAFGGSATGLASFLTNTTSPSVTTNDGNTLNVPLTSNAKQFDLFGIALQADVVLGYLCGNGLRTPTTAAQIIDNAQVNGVLVWTGFLPPPPPHPTSRCVPVDGGGNLLNGVYIADLALFIGPATGLYTNPILPNQITASENTIEGRNSIVLDFNNGSGIFARDLGCVLEWPTNTGTEVYVWQPSIIPVPEGIFNRYSDWDDGGSSGAKFIQGVIIEADSFGVAKTFALQDSDTLSIRTLNECPATFSNQSEQAFSCTPFIAHSVRVISTDDVEWRVWKARIISQPWPELTMNWQTELTSLGMTGWAHAREMNLAYLSTSPVTLTLSFDSIAPIVLTLPSTSGVQNKTKITLPPNKWKLLGFQVSSATAFRVFQDDIEVKLREWGAQGPYGVVKPFGGKSGAGAAV